MKNHSWLARRVAEVCKSVVVEHGDKKTTKLLIKAKQIRGTCFVFKGGEKIVIEAPGINPKETDRICIHASLLW